MRKLLILLTLFMATKAIAQPIPNAGFETWAASGPFMAPTGWAVSPGVIQSNDAHSGSWALQCKVDTFTNPATSTLDTIPANAYTGAATMGPPPMGTSFGGYAFVYMPDSLTGYYKYQNAPNDSFTIIAEICHWDTTTHSRQTIKRGIFSSGVTTATYTRFGIPLQYVGPFAMPDTAFIQVIACNPQAPKHMGTSVWVDDLAFYTYPDAVENINTTAGLVVYPVPFSDKLNIGGVGIKKVSIINILGQTVLETSETTFNTTDLISGNYFADIQTTSGDRVVRQIIKK